MAGRTPQAGKRKCLKCGKVFPSQDVVTNRICGPCNKANDKERDRGRPASAFIYVSGRRISVSED